MPKIKCKCGNIVSLNDIPNVNELHIISDIDFEQFWNDDEDFVKIEDVASQMKLVVKCNNCYRLYIYENGMNEDPIIYKLEEGKWNK
ncbi:hypothetical protein [Epilithonimonas hungarica]|uniref:Uncharacterized protein n=1 Tax=Epilithonimonas hungarica TaxID=454006 RepID=A0A1G7TNM2_9FLAO|nr:hypothetical protein [Epilithonimonas hungarica]SDG36928.1 hypothetical protein SAMN05421825_3175 [Epilithonimonas hungarica]